MSPPAPPSKSGINRAHQHTTDIILKTFQVLRTSSPLVILFKKTY
uniref:WSSV020 n=1 Tax=White spot syndrome virus TaxID=342409 RepID=A0A3G5BHM9_9VIRU|nr:WSSV020 [White spot syndrome virus]QHB92571.1 hypothetical protein [White spot syndrome virus]WOG35290.1 WSSV020 [White spot syndrome virus]